MKELLTDRAKDLTSLDKKCVLLFDEMQIKKELKNNVKDDFIYGYTDFGEFGRKNDVASKVL